MPLSSASTRKPATSASEIRFEIVMVKRSLEATYAIRAGNSIRRAISRIMDQSQGSRGMGIGAASLAGNGERSENGRRHRTLMIRAASVASAITSARQTSSMERSALVAAAVGAASGLRIRILGTRRNGTCPTQPELAEAERPRGYRGLLIESRNNRLFQRGVDRGELGVQGGAEAID